MGHFPNVQESAELKEKLYNSVSHGLIINSDEQLTMGAKIRISEIRRFYGVSRSCLAEAIGTTYRQYIRFEEGRSTLPSWVLEVIALFFNLSVDFVCGISDEPRILYEGDYKWFGLITLPNVVSEDLK